MVALDCDRVSWGPLERPVRMLIESHSSIEVPTECQSDSGVTIRFEFVNTLWVNDTHVADYLTDTYGLPVHVSNIDFNIEDIPGPGVEHTVTWGPTSQRSWLSVTDDTGYSDSPPANTQYFWYNGTVLGNMDFFHKYTSDETGENPATGKMYPPMLMAHINENYVGAGVWMPTTEINGESIQLYRDIECEEPI